MNFKSKTFYYFILFVLVYSALTLLLPSSHAIVQKYHLSPLTTRFLYLSITGPLMAIWYIAFYGYAKLRTYTELVKHNKDGKQVAKITTGIMILVYGLPVMSIASTLSNYAIQIAPHYTALATMARNYVDLLIPLLGFIFVSIGARGLSELAGQRPSQRAVNLLAAVFISIGVLYCYLVLRFGAMNNVYHVSAELVLATLVAPYLYTWFLGLLAAYEVYLYQRKIAGIVYRKSWSLLAYGITAIIVMSIVFQYLTTLSRQFTFLPLKWLLIMVYLILALLSVGYILLAVGTKRLQKIEEV